MGFVYVSVVILLLVSGLYFLVILGFTLGLARLFHRTRTGPGNRVEKPATRVSVVIAARNEAMNITACLNDMFAQDYPHDLLEVLVTDDFSEDYTMEFVNRFALQHAGFNLVAVTPGDDNRMMGGKKRALERAVGHAMGELILFTDADTRHTPAWVTCMEREYARGKPHLVLGPVMFSRESNFLEKLQSLEFLGLMGTTAGSAAVGHPVMCNGANLACHRETWLGFSGHGNDALFASGDDQFLLASVRKIHGHGSVRFLLNQEAIVTTQAENTLKGFLHQRIRWVSKSRGYRDPVVVGVAVLTWLFQFLLLSGMVAGLWCPRLGLLSFFLWIAKMLADYPMVYLMSRFFRKSHLLGYYFAAQLFQLVYVVAVGLAGNFISYRWKGRRIKK
jgi:cellulose synthase/poly-beta-1,6-N-acetylglucosamine synthase-like glycosyltransferase